MSPPARPSPYIGSRSFERTKEDRARFFGRDREIKELVGLVMSHNVVLVYAASGAGKTSLLNAGVIPRLEEAGFEVLPRGRVGGALPPGVVLDERTNPYVLNLLSVLSPGAPVASLLQRTIVDHLRELPRAPRASGRVLVIDQAEELFTFTPPGWPVHQKELFIALHEALRDAPDLRVVLVVREDYLAHLQDLARLLPGGLRARFHLEPLGRAAARQAVEGPLADTGRRFDHGVAAQLVADLSSRVKLEPGTGRPLLEPGPYVEPVHLQIVCDALWQQLPEGVEIITAEHLQRYGDVEETLERFYEETIDASVRETWCDKEQLARWIGEQLITPADTRGQVFRGPDETDGMPNAVVARLEQRRLLHADERASGCWYELAHDRLIRPIRAVNERWRLELATARARQRMRRRVRTAALLGAVAVAGAVAGVILIPRQERARERAEQLEKERALTVDRVEALRARCGLRSDPACDAERVRVFDFVTAYYVGQGRFADLVEVLERSEDQIPASYGMPAPRAPRARQGASARGLVRVEYHPDRPLDEWQLRSEWERWAQWLREDRGLLAPPRITLVPDPRVSSPSLRITAQPEPCAAPATRATVVSLVHTPEGKALISEAELEGTPLRRFFDEHHRRERWEAYEDLKLGGPWWFVPRWTLPVWRVGGHPAKSAEAIVATVVADELVRHPELVLGCDALKVLLQQAIEAAPVSVGEAVAARTLEGLRLDLVELARRGHSLRYLPAILDALAERPGAATAEAVAFAIRDPARPGGGGDVPLHGPWLTPVSADAAELAPAGFYRRIAEDFPRIDPPIRVELGAHVQPAVLDRGVPREEILEGVEELRRDVYLQHGVLPPEVWFLPGGPPDRLRIEVLAEDASAPGAPSIAASAPEAPERLFQALGARYRELRASWLTADALASSLGDLRAGERDWIDRHYSLTDLKRIARAVVAEGPAPDGAATVRDLPWLVRSLAFWSHARDPRDVTALAEALRATQRARLRPSDPARRGHAERVLRHLRRGLAALDAGRMDPAEAHFAAAIATDREAAIAAFLDLYPAASALAPDRRGPHLAAKCRLPSPGAPARAPDAAVAYEVRDLLLDGRAPLAAALRRRLELCLLWSIADRGGRPDEVQRRASALAQRAPGSAETWPREEAFFLAQRWLSSHREQAAPPERERAAIARLLAGSLAGLPGAAMDAVWLELQDALGARPLRWARDLIADVARDLPTGGPSLRLDLASWLGGFGEGDAQRALALVDAIDPGRTPDARWSRAWARAKILARLGQYGAPAQRAQRLGEAAAALPALGRTAPTPVHAGLAFAALADVRVMQGDAARAREAIREGIEASHQPELFDEPSFFLELGEGDEARASEIAAAMVRRAPDEPSTLLVDAIFAILTRRADFEDAGRRYIFDHMTAPHRHADHVRLLLAWALLDEGRRGPARALLAERIREIDPASWDDRLRQRDSAVWREMLILFMAGEISRSHIFDPLRDEASFLASGLSETALSLDGLRCEAHFHAALREHVTGDPATRDARFRAELRRAIELREHRHHEDAMARFLLGRRPS